MKEICLGKGIVIGMKFTSGLFGYKTTSQLDGLNKKNDSSNVFLTFTPPSIDPLIFPTFQKYDENYRNLSVIILEITEIYLHASGNFKDSTRISVIFR